MSSISSSTDDYNNFNQRIRKIEDDVDAERKETRESRDKEHARLEAAYTDAIDRKNKNLERTLNDVRENHDDESTRAREYANANYDELKHRTYDRFAQYAREGALDKRQLADRIEMEKHENDVRNQREQRKLEQLYRTNEERIKDQATYYSGALSQMAQDRAKSESEHNREFTQALTREHDNGKKAIDSAEQAYDRHAHEMNRRNEETLRDQAVKQEETLSRQRAEDNEKISLLEKNIQQRSTGGDRTLVDPAVEEQIRADVGGRYQKLHEAEYARDQSSIESLRHSNSQSVNQLVADHETKSRLLTQRHVSETDRARTDHLNEIQDLQQSRREALRSKDEEASRQAELLNRNYGGTIERQRREFGEQLEQVRRESADKVAIARQDAETALRASQREANARQAALVRDYTKKMQEQKEQFDDQVRDLQARLSRQQDEGNRATKQLLDDQQRQNDKRYAQLETQSKERERTISENYEDQLDKMRRANALLQQRKS